MRWLFIRAAALAACLFAVAPSPVPAATAVDSQLFSNISATTSAFTLKGGYYMVSAVATFGGGNVELKMLGPDQSTYLSLPTALKLTANGTIAGYLPPGTYEVVVTTATAVYVSVAGVPIS
jgi:hypothetical protein